jgi:hypothetical protein
MEARAKPRPNEGCNNSTCIRNALFILNVTVSLQKCPAPKGGGGAGHGRQSPVIYSPALSRKAPEPSKPVTTLSLHMKLDGAILANKEYLIVFAILGSVILVFGILFLIIWPR